MTARRRQLLITMAAATVIAGATVPLALWRRWRRRRPVHGARAVRSGTGLQVVPLDPSDIGPARDLAG